MTTQKNSIQFEALENRHITGTANGRTYSFYSQKVRIPGGAGQSSLEGTFTLNDALTPGENYNGELELVVNKKQFDRMEVKLVNVTPV